jgi:hypothetical protein
MAHRVHLVKATSILMAHLERLVKVELLVHLELMAHRERLANLEHRA